ncbi:unnamed protein product [Chrysodeixis includens]|uniref:Uncharacterized protein n=1 Tax=Chrysodeixis includens TaxID=689277 RepID=A0A9N8PZ02_CHRIL|nr:unnamed protein product [Chrysodeixis includens]
MLLRGPPLAVEVIAATLGGSLRHAQFVASPPDYRADLRTLCVAPEVPGGVHSYPAAVHPPGPEEVLLHHHLGAAGGGGGAGAGSRVGTDGRAINNVITGTSSFKSIAASRRARRRGRRPVWVSPHMTREQALCDSSHARIICQVYEGELAARQSACQVTSRAGAALTYPRANICRSARDIGKGGWIFERGYNSASNSPILTALTCTGSHATQRSTLFCTSTAAQRNSNTDEDTRLIAKVSSTYLIIISAIGAIAHVMQVPSGIPAENLFWNIRGQSPCARTAARSQFARKTMNMYSPVPNPESLMDYNPHPEFHEEPHQEEQLPMNCATRHNLREIYLPPFDPDDGKMPVEDWCKHVDTLIEVRGYPEVSVIMKALSCMKGNAKTWADRQSHCFQNWSVMKLAIIAWFQHSHIFYINKFRIYTSDHAKTYAEYVIEAWWLFCRISPCATVSLILDAVISGLRPRSVQDHIVRANVKSQAELMAALSTFQKRSQEIYSNRNDNERRVVQNTRRLQCDECGRDDGIKEGIKSNWSLQPQPQPTTKPPSPHAATTTAPSSSATQPLATNRPGLVIFTPLSLTELFLEMP